MTGDGNENTFLSFGNLFGRCGSAHDSNVRIIPVVTCAGRPVVVSHVTISPCDMIVLGGEKGTNRHR